MRRAIAIMAVLALAFPVRALALAREALVIGEQDYSPRVSPLVSTVNDARLVGDVLRANDYHVTPLENASRGKILQAVRDFALRLRNLDAGAVGFFYYSGHGVANPDDGRNYLIPVNVESTASAEMWDDSVPLEEVINLLRDGAPKADLIVVFDACREVLHLPTKGAAKSMRQVEGVGGMLIAFSTSPGAVARDGDSATTTGPYATALAAQLRSGSSDAPALFDQVKYAVLRQTGDHQLPWTSNGLRHPVVLTRLPTTTAGMSALVPGDGQATEYRTFQAAMKSRRIDGLKAYLKTYPSGEFVDAANAQIATLQALIPVIETARPKARLVPTRSDLTTALLGTNESTGNYTAYSESDAWAEWLQSIQFAKRSATIVDFLARYPTGRHLGPAQQRIADLQAQGR